MSMGPMEYIFFGLLLVVLLVIWRLVKRKSAASVDRKARASSPRAGHMNGVPAGRRAADGPVVSVHLLPQPRTIQAATETVNVPEGVTITVKRARQVEHAVQVRWVGSLGASAEAGLKGLVSASILGKIEQLQGRSYQEIETVEYEILLNGDKHHQYTLTWVDTLLAGTAVVTRGGVRETLPFEFRAGTELQVIPLGTLGKAT